jgi:hypothetical protein
MLTVNNLSVQFGKRILFDEVNTTLHMVIFMESLVLTVLENLLFSKLSQAKWIQHQVISI